MFKEWELEKGLVFPANFMPFLLYWKYLSQPESHPVDKWQIVEFISS